MANSISARQALTQYFSRLLYDEGVKLVHSSREIPLGQWANRTFPVKIPLRLFARCVKTARHPKKAVSLLLKRHAAELAAEVKKFPGFKPHGLSMFAGGEVNAEGWLTTKLEGFDPAELLRERMGIDDLDERLVSAGVSNNPSCPSTSSASPTS